MKKFIAVAGNIGVGKSTLVGLLAQSAQGDVGGEVEVRRRLFPDGTVFFRLSEGGQGRQASLPGIEQGVQHRVRRL